MDNFDNTNVSGNKDHEKPIPFDDSDYTPGRNVSHQPLSLGGDDQIPKIELEKPRAKKPAEKIVSSERITGVKTFFTKLHAGSIDFLDGQINAWLKDNPGIKIKKTNTTTGEVQGKKTEPNIIVTVWY